MAGLQNVCLIYDASFSSEAPALQKNERFVRATEKQQEPRTSFIFFHILSSFCEEIIMTVANFCPDK